MIKPWLPKFLEGYISLGASSSDPLDVCHPRLNKIFSVTVRMDLGLVILRPFPGEQALLSGPELRPRCTV
jgi:hypothetical protein